MFFDFMNKIRYKYIQTRFAGYTQINKKYIWKWNTLRLAFKEIGTRINKFANERKSTFYIVRYTVQVYIHYLCLVKSKKVKQDI